MSTASELENSSSRIPANVGARLTLAAKQWPDQVAVAQPLDRNANGKRQYDQVTFRELDEDSSHLAEGLLALGAKPGMRFVLMVRPGIDFVSLVFAMFKAGVVTVLIDPGMGRKSLVRCLQEVEPEGFIAIPLAQAVRSLLPGKFPKARLNVTVGRRWFWGGKTLAQLRARPRSGSCQLPKGTDAGSIGNGHATQPEDPAAIIFTTGSTGPPKGVLYRHGNFSRQADEIRDFYGIQPGEVDLPGFPLFALFNCPMGVTTVIPDMDFTRPAQVDPKNIVEAVRDWKCTQAFGSPALWNVVGRYCEQHSVQLPTLRRVLSAGAPVPPHVLERMKRAIHPEGDVHTPYGATEALPVASISASEVLGETASRTAAGAGTCVGRRFPGIEWRVIRIDDGPLPSISQTEELPRGEIGELMVRGPVVTNEYVTRVASNALHKVQDGETFWHRMGDVGYFDERDRFWYCGRKSHRVITAKGTLFTEPCEAIFNTHPQVYRSALVGIGPPGAQEPVIVVETWPAHVLHPSDREALLDELVEFAAANEQTRGIRCALWHPSLPVDIRHNSKIFREKLALWAKKELG